MEANNNNGLARSVKIAHISLQRIFLENIALKLSNMPELSGDPSFRYTGYIFPENLKWLEDNGFDVYSTRFSTETEGRCGLFLYVITPSDDLMLSNNDFELSKELGSNLIDFIKNKVANNDDDDDEDDD